MQIFKIVKSYQNTDENKARLSEFLGRDLDEGELGGKKTKSFKGMFGKKSKLGAKFGRALQKIGKDETAKRTLKRSGGCSYKFGDGDEALLSAVDTGPRPREQVLGLSEP